MLWLGLEAAPAKHLRHGVKVLLKFKLPELQTIDSDALIHWARSTPYFARIYQQHFASLGFSGWVEALLDDLVRARAAARAGRLVHNVGRGRVAAGLQTGGRARFDLPADEDCHLMGTPSSNLYPRPQLNNAVVGQFKEARHTSGVAGHQRKQGLPPVRHPASFGRHNDFPTQKV